MEAITSVHSFMADAARSTSNADRYDISAADMEWEHGGGWDGDRNSDSTWYQPQDWQHGCDWHGWSYWGGWEPAGQEASPAMDLGDVEVPTWMRGGTSNSGDAEGPRACKRWKKDGDDSGTQGRHAAVEEITEDHEAAARLQAQHQDAAAAVAAAGAAAAAAATLTVPAPPTPVAEDEQLRRRKQQIWDQAQNENVVVACSEIADMSAGELEKWAKDNLDFV